MDGLICSVLHGSYIHMYIMEATKTLLLFIHSKWQAISEIIML